MTFPVTQTEQIILKALSKKPLLLPQITSKFPRNKQAQISNVVSNLVCYGVLKQSKIPNSKKFMYEIENRETEVQSDSDVRNFRIKNKKIDISFDLKIDEVTKNVICELAGNNIPRSMISKLVALPKLKIIQVILENEKKIEQLRRKNDRKNQAN